MFSSIIVARVLVAFSQIMIIDQVNIFNRPIIKFMVKGYISKLPLLLTDGGKVGEYRLIL